MELLAWDTEFSFFTRIATPAKGRATVIATDPAHAQDLVRRHVKNWVRGCDVTIDKIERINRDCIVLSEGSFRVPSDPTDAVSRPSP